MKDMYVIVKRSIVTFMCTTTVVLAGSVDPANMTTFVPGNPVVADEMNANFQEIVTQVNDNNTTAFITGQIADGTDTGFVNGRTLVVNKLSDNSDLRISYTDNFRNLGSGVSACVWEIMFDGVSCPSQAIKHSYYASGASSLNIHRSDTIIGYCQGLAAGTHTISVYVSPYPGYPSSDCYTGWESTFVLEAKEVN